MLPLVPRSLDRISLPHRLAGRLFLQACTFLGTRAQGLHQPCRLGWAPALLGRLLELPAWAERWAGCGAPGWGQGAHSQQLRRGGGSGCRARPWSAETCEAAACSNLLGEGRAWGSCSAGSSAGPSASGLPPALGCPPPPSFPPRARNESCPQGPAGRRGVIDRSRRAREQREMGADAAS